MQKAQKSCDENILINLVIYVNNCECLLSSVPFHSVMLSLDQKEVTLLLVLN